MDKSKKHKQTGKHKAKTSAELHKDVLKKSESLLKKANKPRGPNAGFSLFRKHHLNQAHAKPGEQDDVAKAIPDEKYHDKKNNHNHGMGGLNNLNEEKPKKESIFVKGFSGKDVLNKYIAKSGIALGNRRLSYIVFLVAIIINVVLSLYMVAYFHFKFHYHVLYMLAFAVFMWTLIFIVLLFVIWLFFLIFLDLRMFKRRETVEEVFPDFLQLVSANIRSGMPVDRALWFSIRPRFGILAKEMEMVAKQTLGGADLGDALLGFAQKYDSETIHRSINLLLEGMKAGGEIADLLNKISLNIQESKLMRKEMAASIAAYIIFVSFASVIAAPVLFGLAMNLLKIIQDLFGRVSLGDASKAVSFSMASIKDVTSVADFRIFCIVNLGMTSFFSSMIVSLIKKGNAVDGIKHFPAFVVTSITIFFIVSWLIGKLLTGFF